jgi:hypothetical protein
LNAGIHAGKKVPSAFSPVVNYVNPVSAFRQLDQSGTAGPAFIQSPAGMSLTKLSLAGNY